MKDEIAQYSDIAYLSDEELYKQICELTIELNRLISESLRINERYRKETASRLEILLNEKRQREK